MLYMQGILKVDVLRPILDKLTPTCVIRRPFEDHKIWNLKWGETVVTYMPDRCIRHF